MNLRQLEHVIALAEEGSFARAAQRVHLSQPALSRSIQSIEDDLGMALFDRTTREVQITPAGEMVVRRAKKVLFEARCLVRDVDLLRDHGMSAVSFGAGPYPAAMLLPAALDELARHHPQLRINAAVDNWKNLLDALHAETLDFLIVDIRGAQPTSEVDVMALPRHQAAWFVREGHPLAGRAGLDAQALHAYPVVSVPLPDPMREALRKWLRYAPNHELEFHLVCNDVHVLQEYARKTDALLLLTTHAMSDPARMAGLVPLSLPTRSPLWLQFGIVHLAGRTLSPAAEQAIGAFKRVAATPSR
ncbi:LysR family transcriptional regulator [Paraburkholderia tropica]|uniref:LysR family transcriptional regulator n=2 Tax=Paraburkholderia TaxID=1822464 RepID=UPI001CB39308|nr:LysR family transcriptional regulator [Paraburkholderia tropica]CAG9217335.1 LysR family transcriptional regulator [Paraburkholderia tropica]